MHGFDGGWHMGWMWIGWLIVPALLALVVWAVIKGAQGRGASLEPPEQALKRRYARGEIDRETYLRMRSDLKGEG